jgi:hypothetical protein
MSKEWFWTVGDNRIITKGNNNLGVLETKEEVGVKRRKLQEGLLSGDRGALWFLVNKP